MPHVSVHYKVYLTAGHHRQPRNASTVFEPDPPTEADVDGGIIPSYKPQLHYELNGVESKAQLLFWSVTDGSHGQTYPAAPLTLTQLASPDPLTITAWYFPIGGGRGPTEIVDDAFSAVKGDFIDDTFVTVTSDPLLTNQANFVGVVPTATAETLQASAAVASTPEPFSKWISYGAGTPSGDKIDVPAGATGIAIAIYEQPQGLDPIQKEVNAATFGTPTFSVTIDGGGTISIHGVRHPVDPMGLLVAQMVYATLTVAGSRGMDRGISEQVQQLAARAVVDAIAQALPDIEKAAGGKG